MALYTGRFVVSVDGKGRIAVPARLRGVAVTRGSDQFVLNKGMEGCIDLLGDSDWAKIEERVKPSHPIANKDERFYLRDFYSNMVPAPTDTQGRVLVPAFLLKHAGIEKEALILGVGEKIEIWNQAKYEAYFSDFGESPEQVAERIIRRFEKPDA